MLDKARRDENEGKALRRKALEDAIHSHAMEGITVDPARCPELEAIVEGTMTCDEAARAIAARYRKT